jgi:hypothetical protein
VIGGYRRVALSAPALAEADGSQLRAKDLVSAGEVSTAGKYTLEEHLNRMGTAGSFPLASPLLALGLRNNLVNSRAIVLAGGRAVGAEGEDPRRSPRPYYGIGLRAGRFVAEAVLGRSGPSRQHPEPFWAGVPVLWDELSGDELFDRMLTEAADLSHLFDLPRGNHPRATDESRMAWLRLHDLFVANIYAEADAAARALKEALVGLPFPLRRAEAYLHSVLGVDEDGRLINVVAHGRLEEVGRMAAELGCRRAVCVENSGSVMPTFFPQGYPGTAIPLLRAPNFRPKGRVLLVVELENDGFEALSAV